MQNHLELSDLEFEKQFRECELNPKAFSHEAHLRLAWIHIHKYGLTQAVENLQTQLEKFVANIGAKDKYHKTLTVVAVQAVNHFMEKSGSDNFEDFIKEFPQLMNNFKGLINSHYSFDVFASEKARKEYIAPDVLSQTFTANLH